MKRKPIPISSIALEILSDVRESDYNLLPSNIIRVLNKRFDRKYQRTYVFNTISRLKRDGFIEITNHTGGKKVELTSSGLSRLQKYKARAGSATRNQRWDGKWRMVIFDIKGGKRKTRDKIRYELRSFGFVLLQHSVWVYPYDCEEYITLLKADEHVGKSLLYIVAESIEIEKDIKKIFEL